MFFADIEEADGRLYFDLKVNGTHNKVHMPSGGGFPNGDTGWWHIIAEKNHAANTLSMYTNGMLVHTDVETIAGSLAAFTTSGRTLHIGTLPSATAGEYYDHTPNYWYNALLDDIRIEERLWSQAEKDAVYAAGVGTEDDNIGGSVGQDMELVSSNFTYDISFGELHGWLLEQGTTASTNRVLEVSVDGRATWTEIPLTFQQVQILGETNVLSFGTTNPATSGTNLAFRVRGTNMVADSKVNAIIVGGN